MYIYVYIYVLYIYAVKLLSGPSLAISGVIIWGQVGVIIWAKLLLAYKNSGFKRFFAHTVTILVFFFCAQLSGSYLKNSLFKKMGAKNWVFQICVF